MLLWIVVAMVGARSAAMTFNRLVDARIDAKNPRTRMRQLPAGLLSMRFAWGFVAASSAVFMLAAALVAACGTGGSNNSVQSGPTKISVGYSNVSVDFLATWVAKEAGIFDKNGLDVDLELVSGGSRTMAALLSGEMQISLQGGAEALSASAGSADVVVLGTVAPV